MLLTNYFLKDLKGYLIIDSNSKLFNNPFRPYYEIKLVWKKWYKFSTTLKFYHYIVNDNFYINPEYEQLKNQLDLYFSELSN